MTFPQRGQWIRWVAPEFAKEGEVIFVNHPSMMVRWLGSGIEQVFPLATFHFGPNGDMEIIARPPKASQIRRDEQRDRLSVAAAAAALGISEKRVRQRLRSGSLQGRQEGGKWVEVWLGAE